MTGPAREVRLVELADDHVGLTIGGKAAGLVPPARAGLSVPAAVVVPAEAGEDDLHALASELSARFSGSRLAIRSSGGAEDLGHASFAGQYATVLDVPAEPAAVAAAVRRVRESATDTHVASYAAGHDTTMAVLVMPMVDADAAGIAFTRDPITGEPITVIEAVAGLGDRLAAGEETGERWAVNTEPRCLHDLGVLDPSQALEIAELARRCEEIAGTPQDIEWAIADGRTVLLQARPITTLDQIEPIPCHDETPPGLWEWDSAHNRRPMTPLTASVFIPGFEAGSRRLVAEFGAPFDHLALRTINGYLYIQVVPPFGKAGASPPPKQVMRTAFRLVPSLRRRERTAQRALEQRSDRRLLEEWRTGIRPQTEATLTQWFELDRTRLDDRDLAGLLLETAELQRSTFGWNMATDPAYLFPLAELHEFVTAELGGGMETTTRLLAGSSPSEYRDSMISLADRLSPEARTTILSGDGDVISRLATADSGFAEAYREHLRIHGCRILGFDLSGKTLLEDPHAELVRVATQPPVDDPTPEAERLAAELRSSLDPARSQRFDDLVAAARSTYPIREEGEAVHARVMGAVRLTALEVGRRMVAADHLTDAEHVVYLTLGEATEWLSAPSDISDLVAERRGRHLWATSQIPEPFLGGKPALPDPSIFPPNVGRVMRIIGLVLAHDASPAELPEGTDGVAASPGTHSGPVRIVFGPEDFGRVDVGDVLVAPITTSPWEVLFPHIGALVTEGGGLLSHPAIVAREYRLPAVVGCEGATTRFHDGQLVTVDGTAGTVRPLERT